MLMMILLLMMLLLLMMILMVMVTIVVSARQLMDEGRPYGAAAVGEGQWFGYDDEHSVAEKTRLAMELQLGGVFVWDISQDDVR